MSPDDKKHDAILRTPLMEEIEKSLNLTDKSTNTKKKNTKLPKKFTTAEKPKFGRARKNLVTPVLKIINKKSKASSTRKKRNTKNSTLKKNSTKKPEERQNFQKIDMKRKFLCRSRNTVTFIFFF